MMNSLNIQKESEKQAGNERNTIKSLEELCGIFFKDSIDLYVKEKSQEHNGVSNKDMKKATENVMLNLLSDLKQRTADFNLFENTIIEALIKDLPSYIKELDQECTKERDKFISETLIPELAELDPNLLKINSEKLDDALLFAASNSNFAKIAKSFKEAEKLNIKIPIKADIWIKAAGFF